MRARKVSLALAALLVSGEAVAVAPSAEEVALAARSLRDEGRAELEANLGRLETLPLSEVTAELNAKDARLEGTLRLVYTNREAQPLRELVLRTYPNAQHGAKLTVSDVRVDGRAAAAKAHGTVVAVPLLLAPGAAAEVTLRFAGHLKRLRPAEDADALLAQLSPALGTLSGRQHAAPVYGTFAVGPDGAALVDWYPQLAARARGEWDRAEPAPLGDVGHADPGLHIVALTVPHGFRVAGAGTPLGQHAISATQETAAFAAAGVRGALGLAASASYDESDEDVGGVHLHAASLHGKPGAEAMLACAKTALIALQARFGPYPWRELSLAEAQLTGGAGGVEMPGLALLASSLSPGTASGAMPAGLYDFTCWHEVAHQWWQGLVGSDPRREPWVDEALAQYAAVLVAEDARGGGPTGRAAAASALETYVALNYHGMRLARLPDGPVARTAGEFGSPLAYAGLVYGKAPLFYDRARDLMGAERFAAACLAYRRRWAFREASSGAWLQAAQREDARHADALAALERRWFQEKHGDEDIAPPDGATLMDALGGGGNSFATLLTLLQQSGAGDTAQLDEAMRELQRLLPELSRALQDPDAQP